MAAYPVDVHVNPPERFDRAQLALRLVLAIILGALGARLGWLFWLLYLALPAVAAVLISRHGPDQYLGSDAPRVARWLTWLAALAAYFALVVDRFPTEAAPPDVKLVVQPGGRPSVAGALLRLITSLPSAIVLLLLGIVSTLVWLIAAVWILFARRYPHLLHDFQVGMLRWLVRLCGYHASLVEAYPPFSLDTGYLEPTAVER